MAKAWRAQNAAAAAAAASIKSGAADAALKKSDLGDTAVSKKAMHGQKKAKHFILPRPPKGAQQ